MGRDTGFRDVVLLLRSIRRACELVTFESAAEVSAFRAQSFLAAVGDLARTAGSTPTEPWLLIRYRGQPCGVLAWRGQSSLEVPGSEGTAVDVGRTCGRAAGPTERGGSEPCACELLRAA